LLIGINHHAVALNLHSGLIKDRKQTIVRLNDVPPDLPKCDGFLAKILIYIPSQLSAGRKKKALHNL
jgi:hypothetical protein